MDEKRILWFIFLVCLSIIAFASLHYDYMSETIAYHQMINQMQQGHK